MLKWKKTPPTKAIPSEKITFKVAEAPGRHVKVDIRTPTGLVLDRKSNTIGNDGMPVEFTFIIPVAFGEVCVCVSSCPLGSSKHNRKRKRQLQMVTPMRNHRHLQAWTITVKPAVSSGSLDWMGGFRDTLDSD